MHGNRDFLLGEAYAQRAGMRLLEDPTRIELNGKPVLLMHGDTLCTDDVAYQQFRAQTRDPAWQAQFLSQPLVARPAFAQQARSEEHTSELQSLMRISSADFCLKKTKSKKPLIAVYINDQLNKSPPTTLFLIQHSISVSI